MTRSTIEEEVPTRAALDVLRDYRAHPDGPANVGVCAVQIEQLVGAVLRGDLARRRERLMKIGVLAIQAVHAIDLERTHAG